MHLPTLLLALILPLQSVPSSLNPLTPASLLQLTDAAPTAPLANLAPAIPQIVEAANDPDGQTRILALLALAALASRSAPDGTQTGDALLLLEPHLPAIAAHLNDPNPTVREVTALVLGSFHPHPTPAAVAPLIAALARPTPPAPADLGIVLALLNLGIDINPEIAPAVLRFVHRSDLSATLLPRLISAIANHPTHNPHLDAGLLPLLNPPNSPEVRTALIAALPKLSLSPQEIATTRTALTSLAGNPAADQALKAQASAILPCWHASRMADPCPAIPVRYRMVPPPAPVRAPRYQTPPLL